MKFDEIDINIIYYLYENSHQTTSDIAKKIFECKNSRDLLKKDSLVRSRLKKLMDSHMVLCSETTPKKYSTNPKHVTTGMGTFEIKVNGGKTMKIDFGEFLVLSNGNDELQIHKIKEPENQEIEAY